MPRILHLITGLEAGGAERMLARLAAGMDHTRFPTAVVSMTGPGIVGPAIAASGVPLYNLGMCRGRPDPRALLRLLPIVRDFRPDILQTWLYHADLLGLAAWLGLRMLGGRSQLVWNLRCTESSGSAAVRGILARASGLPAAVIVNAAVGQRFHEAIGYRPRRWLHIPNGFDTAVLRPDPAAGRLARAELGIAEDAPAILLPARYDPMKDHANFLKAAALLARVRPEVRFVLAGAGTEPANRALAGDVAAMGLADRVRLLGQRGDLDRLYPAFDLVTLSSAYGEGFPNVLGEAMACGVPCVATDTGDCAAIIGDTGAIVPPRDPAALAAAWQRLLALGAEERRQLGLAARRRVEHEYALNQVVARYEAAYEEIALSAAAAKRASATPAAPRPRR